jgi:hypothetical protein
MTYSLGLSLPRMAVFAPENISMARGLTNETIEDPKCDESGQIRVPVALRVGMALDLSLDGQIHRARNQGSPAGSALAGLLWLHIAQERSSV